MKNANRQYSALKNNFEMIFTNDTKMTECVKSNEEFPKLQVKFDSIAVVKNMSLNSLINVIGICHEIKSLEEFTSKKTGHQLKKRDIIIIDSSNELIPMTLWNNEAEEFNQNNIRAPISLYNIRIKEYNGKKNLYLNRDSDMKINESISEAQELKSWYENLNNDLIKSWTEVIDGEYISIKDIFATNSTTVNILGICYDVGNLKIISTTKSTNELKKKNLTLVDQSETPVIVTLWNAEATNFSNDNVDKVIAIQNGHIIGKDEKK